MKNIGIKVQPPEQTCDDPRCPFHGSLKVHGRIFVGTVKSAKRQKTVSVQWEWRRYIPKYERYEKRLSVVHAHVPGCLHIEEGDKVRIAETRPLSKTKSFVVIEKLTEKEEEKKV